MSAAWDADNCDVANGKRATKRAVDVTDREGGTRLAAKTHVQSSQAVLALVAQLAGVTAVALPVLGFLARAVAFRIAGE